MHMIFQENDPSPFHRPNACPEQYWYVGEPNGIKQVLFERGLYVRGMTEKGPKDGSKLQTTEASASNSD